MIQVTEPRHERLVLANHVLNLVIKDHPPLVVVGMQVRIARRAGEIGLRTAQLEKMGASAHELFDDLTIGNVSSWSQYAIAWVTSSGDDDGGKYFLVDDTDKERPTDGDT